MTTMGRLPHAPRAKKVIEYAFEEARNLKHNYIGTEHILLGLFREQVGIAARVLANHGLTGCEGTGKKSSKLFCIATPAGNPISPKNS